MKQEMGRFFHLISLILTVWTGTERKQAAAGRERLAAAGGMDVVRYYNLILTLFCGVFTM